MQLIDEGVLPQNAKPPKDILLLPTMDYIKWINSLPGHLRQKVIHLSPSCSIRCRRKWCVFGNRRGVGVLNGPRGPRDLHFLGSLAGVGGHLIIF